MTSVYGGCSQDDDIALHEAYGKIVRISPNTLSISDPAEINRIHGLGTKFIKSKFYSLAEDYDGEGVVPDPFILTDRRLHSRMKRSAANAYSLNILIKLEPCIASVTDRLVEKLKGYAKEETTSVEVASLMQAYAMDAVFALTFGKDFNHMDGGDHLQLFRTAKLGSDYMAIFGQIAWIHPYLLGNPWIAKWFFGDQGILKMMELCYSEIVAGQDRTSDEGPMTFLQRLVLNQRQNLSSLTDRELMTHAFNNIAAGSDTTATALRSVIYNTLRHPEVHEKLKAELRSTLSYPVDFATTNKLPYLSAVIKESIRVHPSVGMLLARVVPEGGAEICGHYIASGVEVGVNPWVVHRDAAVYAEPHRFYPDRWLTSVSSEEDLTLMNRSFIPFGHGAHTLEAMIFEAEASVEDQKGM
ncbi:hypothetical protein G7Z17_g4461 [Cylindrodendrum hubeiense]|uniref:Cytochrome P450 n=1 Tax=Cylindrodendrum hubeiense TaxID=595255 RepID=A0A9P5HG12_9HYPO|nr:hypothetical protein G7Z17_g4461 [Cylindrodendrum hubeiense]